MNADNPFENMPVIHRYTRAQAIDDGVLVDLSGWARETGFVIPVACTVAVWNQFVEPPPGTQQLGQSERGRAHDLLFMLHTAIRAGQGGDRLLFSVRFLQSNHRSTIVQLKAICGPGDDGEPTLTIMLLQED